MISVVLSSGTETWEKDGFNIGTTTPTINTQSDQGIQIGSRVTGPAEQGTFQLFELVAYDRAMTTLEREELSNHFITKYNI